MRAQTAEALAVPLYEPAEAARLVRLTRGQVARWLFGYSYPYRESQRRQDPIVRRQLGTREARRASFLDLIELRAAKVFLDSGLSPQKVRRAFAEAQKISEEPFPFASKRIVTAGPKVFLKFPPLLPAADRDEPPALLELLTGGQWAIEQVFHDALEQLEFDDASGLAETWWPLGKSVPVKITPRRAFGSPTIKSRNLTTSSVLDLFLAEGRRIEPVASWFSVETAEIEAAVRYEEGLSVAARAA